MTTSINSAIDESAGKAQNSQGLSVSAFITSLTISLAAFGVAVAFFAFARRKLPLALQPRVFHYLHRDPPPLYPVWLAKLLPFLGSLPDAAVIKHCGLDCFMLLRFLRTVTSLSAILSAVVCPLVISLGLFGGRGNEQHLAGLDRLTWGGISLTRTAYYWGYLAAAGFVVVFTCHTIISEMRYFVEKCSDESLQLKTLAARTVLVTNIPEDSMDQNALKRRYEHVPGKALEAVFVRDTRSLDSRILRRDKIRAQLEQAEVKRLRSRLLNEKWARSLLTNFQHRLLPLFSRDVASDCEHLWRTLRTLSRIVTEDQGKDYEPIPSALVRFETSAAAVIACSPNFSKDPFSWKTTLLSGPDDVLWKNLHYGTWNRAGRETALVIITAGLVLGWAVPLALSGMASHLDYLSSVPALRPYLVRIPRSVLAILQGTLPQALSAVLMMVFPSVLRKLIELRKMPTAHEVKLVFQQWYFAFLFIHLFITVSISSGIAAVLSRLLGNVKSIPSLLAQNLPKASNFFLSYIAMQSLFISASILLQATGFFARLYSRYFATQTPRRIWARQSLHVDWGHVFPVYTNLVCIVLIYSVMAPLILPIGALGFGVLWIVYRYIVIYIANPGDSTSGRLYPVALLQVFTGIYTLELCLVGLFFLTRDSQGNLTCMGQGIASSVSVVLTAAFHRYLYRKFAPFMTLQSVSSVQGRPKVGQAEESLQQPAFTTPLPTLWLPESSLSDDYKTTDYIRVTTAKAFIDSNGIVHCAGNPLEADVRESQE